MRAFSGKFYAQRFVIFVGLIMISMVAFMVASIVFHH